MAKSNTIRKNFSISRKFQQVDDILASLPDSDQSRFICEAILHYNEFKNNPNWLLQQVAPIVQMQQQLSALYPTPGTETGFVATKSAPPAPPVPLEPEKVVNVEPEYDNSVVHKDINMEQATTVSSTKEVEEAKAEQAVVEVESPTEEPKHSTSEEETNTNTAPKNRRRVGISTQFNK